MRPFSPFIVLAMALALAACGDDEPPHHGMKVEELPDTPTGDEIVIPYAFEADDRWVGELTLTASQEKKLGRNAKLEKGAAVSTFAFEQRYLGGDPARSEATLGYRSIHSLEGVPVETVPKGKTIANVVHQASGRPDPTSLRLSGALVAENQTLFRSLLLAGLGGSESWLPDRPIHPGSTWPVKDAIDPKLVEVWRAIALRPDSTLPPATMQGMVRLERIEEGRDGKVLVLRIDCLLELEGPVTSGRLRATLSMGYRVEGTAHVDARTGIPVRLDTKARMDMKQVGSGDEMTWKLDLALTGSIARESP